MEGVYDGAMAQRDVPAWDSVAEIMPHRSRFAGVWPSLRIVDAGEAGCGCNHILLSTFDFWISERSRACSRFAARSSSSCSQEATPSGTVFLRWSACMRRQRCFHFCHRTQNQSLIKEGLLRRHGTVGDPATCTQTRRRYTSPPSPQRTGRADLELLRVRCWHDLACARPVSGPDASVDIRVENSTAMVLFPMLHGAPVLNHSNISVPSCLSSNTWTIPAFIIRLRGPASPCRGAVVLSLLYEGRLL